MRGQAPKHTENREHTITRPQAKHTMECMPSKFHKLKHQSRETRNTRWDAHPLAKCQNTQRTENTWLRAHLPSKPNMKKGLLFTYWSAHHVYVFVKLGGTVGYPAHPRLISLSVSPSFSKIFFNYSAENLPGPTDLVNKYVKIVNQWGIVSQIFSKIYLYNDSCKNQGNSHTLLRLYLEEP